MVNAVSNGQLSGESNTWNLEGSAYHRLVYSDHVWETVPISCDPPRTVAFTNRFLQTTTDVWAGSYDTIALTTDNEVLACGLNKVRSLPYYNF